jgi:hypothetical protein
MWLILCIHGIKYYLFSFVLEQLLQLYVCLYSIAQVIICFRYANHTSPWCPEWEINSEFEAILA